MTQRKRGLHIIWISIPRGSHTKIQFVYLVIEFPSIDHKAQCASSCLHAHIDGLGLRKGRKVVYKKEFLEYQGPQLRTTGSQMVVNTNSIFHQVSIISELLLN